MDMSTIFNAQPISTWQLFVGQGVGFYIPGYQREYSWDSSNIDRLFEDFGHGLQMLQMSSKKDAVTFIGALIVIHDTKYETVEPSIKGQLPGKVLLLIDGQQRISTILMIHSILHEQLAVMLRQLRRLDPDMPEESQWLANQITVALEDLRISYEEDMRYGDDGYRWYPRIIRAYDDTWSRESVRANYSSPIAAFLHGYARFARNDGKSEYSHAVDQLTDPERHTIILKNSAGIRDWIRKLAKGAAEIELPALDVIVNDAEFQESLLSEPFPEAVRTRVLAILADSSGSDSAGSTFLGLARLLIFNRYLLTRVAVTLVTANNEDYAFDMFEALNTTGTPLTAFETFRPRVILAENLIGYERSPSREHMKTIEEYVEVFTEADKKQKATDRLLVPFALAESGFKLSKRLREQRSYLRQRYDELKLIEEKRAFIEHMAHTSVFIKHYWPESSDEPSRLSELSLSDPDITCLCMEILRSSKHEITIAPLVRFFAQYQKSSGLDRLKSLRELEAAIKAVTAFWVLWRCVRRSTGGIDSRYRELMERGNQKLGIKPLARRDTSKPTTTPGYTYSPSPNSQNLIEVLRDVLASRSPGIATKSDWIQNAKDMPFYDTTIPTAITRLVLLAANHDTVPSEVEPGLVLPARNGTMPLMSIQHWRLYSTIEHIAPVDRNAKGWDSRLYEDRDLIHQIGNLTLLPQVENSVVGNRPWRHKQYFYAILAARTQPELNARINDAKSVGLNLKLSTQELLKISQCLPQVGAIAQYSQDWNAEFIKKRSEQILDIAWTRIAAWLQYP